MNFFYYLLPYTLYLGNEPGKKLTFELGGLGKNGKKIKAYNLKRKIMDIFF
jgi:hypothetical protein